MENSNKDTETEAEAETGGPQETEMEGTEGDRLAVGAQEVVSPDGVAAGGPPAGAPQGYKTRTGAPSREEAPFCCAL